MKGIDWRFKSAIKRVVLVCLAGFSFYQAVELVLQAIKSKEDDDGHDDGPREPVKPPDDEEKYKIVYENKGTIDEIARRVPR